jgi:hypothetical protein
VEITIQQTKEDTKITIVQKQVPVKEVSSKDIYFGSLGDIIKAGTVPRQLFRHSLFFSDPY